MIPNPALSAFLRVYGITWVLGLLLVSWFDKGQFVIWFDQLHTPVLNVLFIGLTYLGDGAALAMLCLVFLLIRYKYAIALTLIGLLQLVSVAVLKKGIFGRTPRPLAYLEEGTLTHLVPNITIHQWYSFPSGHTVTAFGLCFFIALVNEKKHIAYACVAAAWLIGLSRVYLAQHFLVDVVAGSAVGVLLTGAVYVATVQVPTFWKNEKLNRPYSR